MYEAEWIAYGRFIETRKQETIIMIAFIFRRFKIMTSDDVFLYF